MYIIISGVFLSSAPEVNPISACPAEEDKLWKIQWPTANLGSTQFVRCPGEGDNTEGMCLYTHVRQQRSSVHIYIIELALTHTMHGTEAKIFES